MDNQRVTISVIETKEFRVAARGYDQHEVDEFLDSICDEFERMEDEISSLKKQIEMIKAEKRMTAAESGYAAPPVQASPEGSFREILEMAQRVKEQTITDAQNKAAEIIANAQAEANARIGGLEEEKAHLENLVGELKTSAREYKEKFAALLASHKELLDKTDDL